MESHLTEGQRQLVNDEMSLLAHVQTQLAQAMAAPNDQTDYDQELLALRDQLAEARAEDRAVLVEHMTRLSALRTTRDREYEAPANPKNPYFARIQLRDEHRGSTRVREVLIGRRAFIDTQRNVQIVDWRNSPISRIYYCYEAGDDYEEKFAGELQRGHLDLRHTVNVSDGELVRIRAGRDVLVRNQNHHWVPLAVQEAELMGGSESALRAPNRHLGRRGDDQRLPEITALIDPAQFRMITERDSGTIVIRGGAGTGKTTIALHRVAYLFFQDKARFSARKIMVITPGDALKKYVATVLPALDVKGVRIWTFPRWAQTTAKSLVPSLRKRKNTDETPIGARRLKRHPALLKMLSDAVNAEARGYDDAFYDVGGQVVLNAWVQRRNLPPAQRIRAFEKWCTGPGKTQINPVKLALKKLVDQAFDELLDPVETWASALTDRAFLARGFKAAGAQFYEWELDQLVDTVSKQSDDPSTEQGLGDHATGIDGQSVFAGDIQGRLDTDDWAILLRICQLKYGRLSGPSGQVFAMEHVIVDEAQDLSPLSIKVLCDTAKPGAPVTLAGDTAQRLYLDGGFGDWEQLIEDIQVRARILPPLAVSYRSTRQVMKLARHVLGNLVDQSDVRDARNGAPVSLIQFDEMGESVAFLADALKSLRNRERRSSVALVARSMQTAQLYYASLRRAEVPDLRLVTQQDFDFTPGIDVTDIYQIKGLEYDYVVLLETTAAQYPDTIESRHLLHVAMTRAAHQLWLLCSDSPSPLLPKDMTTDTTAAEHPE